MNLDEIIKKMKAAVEGVRKAIYGVEVREYIAQGLENVLEVGQVTVDSAKAAKASEDAAKASEDAAKTSETNAKGSETAAAASRDEAELIKGDAENSAHEAANSQAEAKKSEEAAKHSADRAAAIVGTDKTLTISGAAADAAAVGDRLTTVYTKAEIDTLLANLNICPFEVGDVLQTTSSVSPAARFGGTWEEIAANRVLMGASSSHAAGTTAEAGLPDITGSVGRLTSQCRRGPDRQQGAFDFSGTTSNMGFESGSAGYGAYLNFHASKCNAIYGASDTVQPAAYYVHIWRRIA